MAKLPFKTPTPGLAPQPPETEPELIGVDLATIEDDQAKDLRATAQDLKRFFLDNAEPLVKEYIDAALGTGTLKSNSAEAREEVWDVLKTLMLQASDKIDIQIETAQDVLDAVSSGKCTFKEGEQLLDLYKKMAEIEGAKNGSLGVAGGNGLTINILSQAEAPETKPVIEAIEHGES